MRDALEDRVVEIPGALDVRVLEGVRVAVTHSPHFQLAPRLVEVAFVALHMRDAISLALDLLCKEVIVSCQVKVFSEAFL